MATPAEDDEVSSEVMGRMILAITNGEPYKLTTAAERAVFEDLKQEIAEIKARGEIVELPVDI
jgi:hypothetical protein